MKNPNAAAFLAAILICAGAFCAWASPSFSYPTTYPNAVPMTDPGQLQMQNPPVLGVGGEQVADNNKTNAEAYKSAQEGNAAIIEANAIGTLAAAEACKLHPYGPGCNPQPMLDWKGVLAVLAACFVLAMGLFGWVKIGTHPS